MYGLFYLMNSYDIDILKYELDRISSTLGIIGCALVERNGLTITSELPRTLNEKSLAAMTATMFEAMESAIPNKEKIISNITVEYEDYEIFITKVNGQVLFIGLIEYNIDLGLILIEIEEFVTKISQLLEN
jgi:predicted regulator of Ras-like GTPase activity (Roadblock/LC7/MglB family)